MMTLDPLFLVKAVAWLAAAVVLLTNGRNATLGTITLLIALVHAAASVSGTPDLQPSALALLAAVGLHFLAGLPDGRLTTTSRRVLVGTGYTAAAAVAFAIQAGLRPGGALLALGVIAAVAAIGPSVARYKRSSGIVRQGMQWIGWGITVAAGLAGAGTALHLLLGWPEELLRAVSVCTLVIPIAIAIGSSPKTVARIDRLLVHTVSLAGLAGVVFASYVLIVVGLGRVPTGSERTIIGLSMGAAALAAIFYVPARERLSSLANRIVYGERHAPDEVLRTFGSRLSRAIPMDELLLQLAESLRKTFALKAAEIWTGADGLLERTVSEPERPAIRLEVGPKELPVVARAGVSGPAWIKIWLPAIAEGREDSMVRLAPIAHSGELLGLIVVEREDPNDPFGEENERVLAELARQVALALHNVQLDSALQASLDELKAQAEDLRRSRERVVAAGDAERRKIERNIHDGAQQRLVALKVRLRLAQRVVQDPQAVTEMLEQLGTDIQETIEELRALSHGIFPPVLVDRGLVAALESAATRAALPVTVEGEGVGRYTPEIEAAVYFCCLEALQNAGKYAGDGAAVMVTLRNDRGTLEFEVRDDGAGFDPATRGRGIGFENMHDRIGAIGGTLTVTSRIGEGVAIRGRVPIVTS